MVLFVGGEMARLYSLALSRLRYTHLDIFMGFKVGRVVLCTFGPFSTVLRFQLKRDKKRIKANPHDNPKSPVEQGRGF